MRIGALSGDQFISREHAVLQVALLIGVVASGPTSDAVQAGLLVWALRSPLTAFKALSLFVVVRSLNPQLASSGVLAGTLAWALPLAVSVRLLPLITRESLRLLVPLWIVCGLAVGLSVLSSPAVAVSILKALTLAVVASGVLVGSQRLTLEETGVLGTWLRTLAVVVTALSLLTIVRPSLAHMPNSALLNGILNQSQALGILLAPFAAASLAQWMLAGRSAASSHMVAWAAILLCTMLTASRTAAVAAIAGFGLGMLGGRVGDSPATAAQVRRAVGLVVALGFVLLIVELASGSVLPRLSEFVLKGREGSVEEAFEASRGGLVSDQLRNFMASPWIGNGFGVYADGAFPSGVKTFLGIPVSAAVEKGVLPTAILEETGIVGFLSVAYMLYVFVSVIWRRGPHPVLAMFFACLLVNLGEAILLSPGGMGLYVWLLMAWCIRAAQLEPAATGIHAEAQPATPSRPFSNILE